MQAIVVPASVTQPFVHEQSRTFPGPKLKKTNLFFFIRRRTGPHGCSGQGV